VPYQWGGGSLDGPTEVWGHGTHRKGFDCSGLVMYAIYQASGHKIILPYAS
jgi:cell wall-associated NlpC family hydrolase